MLFFFVGEDDHWFPQPLIQQQTQEGRLERALWALDSVYPRTQWGQGARAVASGSLASWEKPGVAGWGCLGPQSRGLLSCPGTRLPQEVSEAAACGSEGLEQERMRQGLYLR